MRTYTIVKNKTRTGDKKITGTLEELCKHFGKTAKSMRGLMNQVRDEYADREAAIYDRTTFTVTTHTAAETKAMAKEKVARTENLFNAIDSATREPEHVSAPCNYCGGCC
jgi:Sec-independent protein translocase protein TatA